VASKKPIRLKISQTAAITFRKIALIAYTGRALEISKLYDCDFRIWIAPNCRRIPGVDKDRLLTVKLIDRLV
jgi:hypothetical protein